jgi:hypothetical protein
MNRSISHAGTLRVEYLPGISIRLQSQSLTTRLWKVGGARLALHLSLLQVRTRELRLELQNPPPFAFYRPMPEMLLATLLLCRILNVLWSQPLGLLGRW